MLGDDIVENDKPCLQQMTEMYEQYKTTILGVQEIPLEDVILGHSDAPEFVED